MGRVGFVLDIERIEELEEKTLVIKIDPGGGNLLTVDQFAPSGVDAPPMDGDYVLTVTTPGEDGEKVIGYLDTLNAGTAEKGEFRAYSRDEDGAIAIAVILKKDGTIEFGEDPESPPEDFMVRYNELETAYNDLKTQVQTELTKIATTLGSFAIPPVIAYVNVPLTADVSKAKIEEFLCPEWEAPE